MNIPPELIVFDKKQNFLSVFDGRLQAGNPTNVENLFLRGKNNEPTKRNA
ncbi:hypothetical protein HFA01_00460 [Halobacillus faecis]|uniref:Uncharacterized protein n=1 Tax=Halobacillus faecis TaxID=360184 RepID=A0A511WKY7_9BACI|nr:hypothetical protein HFA01_00460 [Halobacillus faecis]